MYLPIWHDTNFETSLLLSSKINLWGISKYLKISSSEYSTVKIFFWYRVPLSHTLVGSNYKSVSQSILKAKWASWNWDMKNNFMARYCRNCIFLDRDFLWAAQWIPNHFQFISSMFWTCCNNLFSVKYTIIESLKLSHINFDKYFFVFSPIGQ